jgi:hypothetical protein
MLDVVSTAWPYDNTVFMYLYSTWTWKIGSIKIWLRYAPCMSPFLADSTSFPVWFVTYYPRNHNFSNKKYRHFQTDAAFTFRKLRRKSNFAPIWTEYTYGHLYMSVQWVQLKSKLQHTGTCPAAAWLPRSLCCSPAVFFRHLIVGALSLPQGKIRRDFQNCRFFKF